MSRLVVATRSPHKLREIREILAAVGGIPDLELVGLDEAGVPESPQEEGIEVYDTFAENALAKARFFSAAVDGPVLADDSGLSVDALGGEPGVRSKRFSGRSDLYGAALDRANNALLLARLQGVPSDRRTAHYTCAVALSRPGRPEALFEGHCHGLILPEPRGAGGFGYDPLFLLPELGSTFAEIPPHQKNELSHRARALRAAGTALEGDWLQPPSR